MNWIITVIIIVYIIGFVFVMGLKSNSECDVLYGMFWPLILAVFIISLPFLIVFGLGELVGSWFDNR